MDEIKLSVEHCQQVMESDLLIGSYSKKKKMFTFNPWANEYRVWHHRKIIDSGQAVEELLDVYNSL